MRAKAIAGGALVTVLVLGILGTGAAIASSTGDDNPRRGVVEAPHQERENEATEARASEQTANIGMTEAGRAALDAQPGDIVKVEREDEHGYPVYEVEVAGSAGTIHELSVDARDGDILARETADQDHGDDDRGDDRDDDGGREDR